MPQPQQSQTQADQADQRDQAERPDTVRLILGTAGHIDHGKTTLIKALTGTDTDRLPEEKLRGLTIELGFAELSLGRFQFGVVDVPGHERFIRTMAAGASGIDLALVVVAADDSVMPQTVEHLEVLRLLGVQHAVCALTKIDAVDAETADLAMLELRELLDGMGWTQSPICPVSSTAGTGLDELGEAIVSAASKVTPCPSTSPFRMPIDRVFTVQGRGTVVTGSVQRGQIAIGDELELLPGRVPCRVRGLQNHGRNADRVFSRQRAAINLTGVDRESVERGGELATPGYVCESRILDARLTALASLSKPIQSAGTFRINLGTRDESVRVVLPGQDLLAPGETCYAQLRSGVVLNATFGQRFILRHESTLRTVAGGVVLAPVGRVRQRSNEAHVRAMETLDRGRSLDRVEVVLTQHGFDRPTELQLCAEAGIELSDVEPLLAKLRRSDRLKELEGGDLLVTPDAIRAVGERLVRVLDRYHRRYPDTPGRKEEAVLGWLERASAPSAARPLLAHLLKAGVVRRFGSYVCLPAFAPQLSAADERHLMAMIEEIRAGAFQPPSLDELSIAVQTDKKRRQRLAVLAAAMGELVQIQGSLYLHAESESRLRETVAEMIGASGSVAVAEVRERLGSTRKFAVPFLEYLDRIGFTRREGDQRVLNETGS